MFFGIDIGGTKLQFAARKGDEVLILNKEHTPASYEDLLEAILFSYKEAESKIGIIRQVGIGLPGTFSREHITWVPNIPYLNGKSLVADLQNKLGVPAIIGNDAQLGLLGEMWRGAGKGRQNAILMSIGTGIGGAIMVGGRIIRGRRGAAGALGWLNLDAYYSPDKNHGYIEKFASGTALKNKGQSMSPSLTTYEIVERAKQGNPQCIEMFNDMGRYLGTALASIASVLDTELIILSGGLSHEVDLFKKSLDESFKLFSAPGVEDIPIVRSDLDNLSGAFGAIRLAEIKEDIWI